MMSSSEKALRHLAKMHEMMEQPNPMPPENARRELVRIAVSAQEYVEDTSADLASYREETKQLQANIKDKAKEIFGHLQQASQLHENTLQTKVVELTETQKAISEHARQYQHVYDKLNPFFNQSTTLSASTGHSPQPQK